MVVFLCRTKRARELHQHSTKSSGFVYRVKSFVETVHVVTVENTLVCEDAVQFDGELELWNIGHFLYPQMGKLWSEMTVERTGDLN